MSSSDSFKSKISAFAFIRSGLMDLGITEIPLSSENRRTIWASVTPENCCIHIYLKKRLSIKNTLANPWIDWPKEDHRNFSRTSNFPKNAGYDYRIFWPVFVQSFLWWQRQNHRNTMHHDQEDYMPLHECQYPGSIGPNWFVVDMDGIPSM